MRYASLCSGICAPTLAWRQLGWTCAGFSEIDGFPRAVLEHHHPDIPLLGDFTELKGDEFGDYDLLVAGTPCQDFSVAGLRKGLDGERGNLTLELLRFIQRSPRPPKWLVWENVPGVLSIDGGRAFGAFLGALAELGYGYAWRVLDAQNFGVPQRRRRVFVVGHLGDWRPAAAVLFERQGVPGDHPARGEAGQGVAGSSASSAGGSSGEGDSDRIAGMLAFGGNDTRGPIDVATAVLAHGGPHGHQDFESETFVVPDVADPIVAKEGAAWTHEGENNFRLRNVVPHPAQAFTVSENSNGFAWTSDVAATVQAMPPNDTMNQQYGVIADNEAIAFSCKDSGQDAGPIAPTLRGMAEVDGNQNGGGQIAVAFAGAPCIAFDTTQITHPENRSRPEPGDPCHPLAANGHPPALAFEPRIARGKAGPVGDVVGALTKEADRGDGHPCVAIGPGPTEFLPQSSRVYTEEGLAPALQAAGSNDGPRTPQVVAQAQARRLTPTEAERLQGFPDGFTLVEFKGKPAADGNRYKALGNSMAVPVLYWIGWRIEIVEQILLDVGRERPDQAAIAQVEEGPGESPAVTGKGASQDAQPVGAAPYYPFPNEADGVFPVSTNPKDAVGRRKVPLGLLPAAGKIHGALAAADGARKYGPYNWREHEVLLTIYLDAIERHVEALRDGQNLAPDSHVHHLGHVIACASIVLDALELGKLIDDRPKPGPAAALLDRHTKVAT